MSRFVQIAALALALATSTSTVAAADQKTSNFLLLASQDFAPQFPSSPSNPVITHSASYNQDFDGLHPNRHTQLDYTVEHSDNVLLLDTDLRVNAVACNADGLDLTLTDASAASAFVNDLIMGQTKLVGHCVGDGSYGDVDEEVVYARQIDSIASMDGNAISFATTVVDASAVYKNAKIQFSTNSYGMFATANSHCSVWDIIRGKCSAQVNETKTWDDLFHYDYSGKTIWSGSVGSNPSIDASVVCTSCFTKLTPELVFNLQIENNKLVNVEVVVEGLFTAEVEATVSATGAFSQANAAIPVYTIEVPDLAFFVGAFPIHVHFSVPITASYDVTLQAQASATSGLTVNGNIGAGFGYEGVPPKWGPIFTESFGYDVIKPTGQANGNGLLKVGLTPSFHLDIDMIASGEVDVAPYLELDVQASTASRAVARKVSAINAQAQVFAGLDVDVQAELGVVFKGHSIGPHESFGPKNVYSVRKQIWSGSYPAAQSTSKRVVQA